ncbi:MAG: NAD(P)/FAD-dependent oxidoreductase [Desulfurococcales archaeon]|nr:NAD(P)/FAD-dependent oxidoreductase [Desulfurococcales archaeon]
MSRPSGDGVTILGLGPAGATLAYEASRRGIPVRGYDIARRYTKACGNATPRGGAAHYLAEYLDAVITDVDTFHILVNGREIETLTPRRPLWVILDKGRFVDGLRELAVSEGASITYTHRLGRYGGGKLLVDARGPYSNLADGTRTLIYRVIARARWPENEALIDFRVDLEGLYWVFPAGHNAVNAGAGFLSIPPSEAGGILPRLVKDYLGAIDKDYSLIDGRAAPISLLRKGKLYDSQRVYIGESAGLVNALSGEGIRQAVVSALRLAEALDSCGLHVECTKKRYRTYARTLLMESELSRLLLRMVINHNKRKAERLLESLSPGFWVRFLEGSLLKALVYSSRPSTLARIVGLLLSSAGEG